MRRPLRDRVDKLSEKVPKGPLRVSGDGNVVGAAGYLTSRAINNTVLISSLGTLGGVNIGFRTISHSVEELNDGREKHTMRINAFSRDVAEFAGKYLSSPSNVEFVVRGIDVKEVNLMNERRGSSTWEVITIVDN